MDTLIQELRTFAAERDWQKYHSPKNLSMALAVEVAELVEHFQWLTEEQSLALSEEKLAAVREEIGDVLIYLVRLCDRLGVDPLLAAMDKLRANRRKYPAERARGKADKYSEYGF